MARVAAAGDSHALAVLYERYSRASYTLAHRVCRDSTIAQDAVQEAFVTLWQQASRFDPQRGAVSTWLLTIVHHRAVDAIRRENGVRSRSAPLSLDELADATPSSPGATDALELLFDAEDARHVRTAVHDLPAHQREVLLPLYYDGYTQREVADHLGLPLGTVKSRCYSAVHRLHAELLALWRRDDAGGST